MWRGCVAWAQVPGCWPAGAGGAALGEETTGRGGSGGPAPSPLGRGGSTPAAGHAEDPPPRSCRCQARAHGVKQAQIRQVNQPEGGRQPPCPAGGRGGPVRQTHHAPHQLGGRLQGRPGFRGHRLSNLCGFPLLGPQPHHLGGVPSPPCRPPPPGPHSDPLAAAGAVHRRWPQRSHSHRLPRHRRPLGPAARFQTPGRREAWARKPDTGGPGPAPLGLCSCQRRLRTSHRIIHSRLGGRHVTVRPGR